MDAHRLRVPTLPRSHADLLTIAGRYIPGASLGMMSLPRDLRMVMVRGCGSKIYDADGNEYIDFLLGSGPLLLGHGRPEVQAAVRRQIDLGSTFFALNEPALRLAEEIIESVPCGESIRFQTTGSEATFAALRLARAFTARDKVLKFEGGWHGSHDVAQLSSTPQSPPPFPSPDPDCDGISDNVRRDVLVAPFNDVRVTTETIEAHARDIAAVLVEPLQRAIAPAPGFLEALRDLTRRYGILLVFDEIVTGFRIAWGGAQQYFGVMPDLACYGKVIGGGYPLSAIVGRRDILAAADATQKGVGRYCFLSGTFAGNPIAAAAGLATLKVLAEPGVYETLHRMGEQLRGGVRAAAVRLGEPVQVLGTGPLLQVYFTDLPVQNWRDGLSGDRRKATQFGHELIRRRIYCTPGGKLYLSLAHTDSDIAETLERVADALRATCVGRGATVA